MTREEEDLPDVKRNVSPAATMMSEGDKERTSEVGRETERWK
jgi:hypothetical protein